MSNETTELKPCFCGRIPKIVTRDVEPQEDRFFSGKNITFVLCECVQCLFDGEFHEGFVDELDAVTALRYLVVCCSPEGVWEMERALEAAKAYIEGEDCSTIEAWSERDKMLGNIDAALAKYRGEA